MTSEPAVLSAKEEKILDCALELLRETGDAGLTMRRIAECAGMRLSNVQYYFRSRDAILRALVVRYIGICTDELQTALAKTPAKTPRDRARALILSGLRHGDELTEMCRIFRELWAISSRNETVHKELMHYYCSFSDQIADFILGESCDCQSRDRLRCLLLPFFEGYSIVAPSLPLRTEETVEMLTDFAMSLVNRDVAGLAN